MRRSHADDGAEGADEGAVIVEAALVRDLGNGAIGLAEMAARRVLAMSWIGVMPKVL